MNTVRLVAASAIAMIAASSAGAGNVVVNGAFDAGNSGFGSGYTFGSVTPEGGYVIASNPAAASGAYGDFASFGDHTSGDGPMLIANGASSPGVAVWSQTITLVAGMVYAGTFYAADVNASNASPARLQYRIDGVGFGDISVTTAAGAWHPGGGFYFAATGGTAVLSIVDLNTAGSFNDFALDDITFFDVPPVPEPATWAMLVGGFGMAGAAMRRVCGMDHARTLMDRA